jgi:hypothetical protein
MAALTICYKVLSDYFRRLTFSGARTIGQEADLEIRVLSLLVRESKRGCSGQEVLRW